MGAGTPQKFSINGISFDLAFDVNLSGLLNEFENSVIATSGRGMAKKTKRVVKLESVVLITSWAEKEVLRTMANELTDGHKFSITYGFGDTLKSEGVFNIESDESEENRTTISISPVIRWTLFAA